MRYGPFIRTNRSWEGTGGEGGDCCELEDEIASKLR